MKTDHLIKALLAIIIVTFVMTICHIGIVKAKIDKNENYKNASKNLLKMNKTSIYLKNPNSLKIEVNTEELRKINIARKKAEELKRQKEEEERIKQEEKRKAEEAERLAEEAKKQVYEGLTLEQLSNKLNNSLNSTLSGKGETFAKLAVELGIDPYLSVAIVLHETGCKWDCSTLLKACNNVGGMKGAGGCNGGVYASFPTLDEGINAYMNNLYNNYVSQGLTTPESMGPKYAANAAWASQVRSYMNEIRAN